MKTLLAFLLAASGLAAQTLVEIGTKADGLVIDLRYTTADNFFKTAFYPRHARAMLRPATAAKLALVQAELKSQGLSLKIWDAYRPLSVQRAMWKTLPDERFVADPSKGGRHNRGAALDATLVDSHGVELQMPTAHDDFSEKAGAHFKLVPPEIFKNREKLQQVMTKHGFALFESEWWHFDDADWKQYEALDIPIEPLQAKHLLLDSRVVQETLNAKLILGTPQKHPANPLIQADKPWENSMNNLYPNVIWDEDAQLLKLWYKCVLADKEVIAQMDQPSTVHDVGWYLLYATSKDGIHWDKPELGIHKFAGSSANNIVARDCPNVGVFKDLHDADPARRYKMVSDVGLGKPQVRFSADGIHWGEALAAHGFGAQNGDTHNNAFWDERSGKYLWFTKLYLGERLVSRFESDDFLHWKNNGLVLRSNIDEGRASQTYCMPVFRYGSIYLSYVMMYNVGSGRSVDCELAWSHDGLQWQRVAPGTPFIPRGAKGSYDSECIYAMAGPPILKDGKLMIYYGGDDFPHTGWKRHCLPCLATLRPDGFAGYTPVEADKPAHVLTRTLRLTSEPVCITADLAPGGSLRVLAINDQGTVLDTAEAISTSVTDAPLKWNKGPLTAPAARFRIELDHAVLYAISGGDLVHQEMPPPENPLKSATRVIHPTTTQTLSFDADAQGWKGVDQLEHHAAGGAKGGYIHVSRSGRALPIALSPVTAKESPLAGDWTQVIGGKGAEITCQVRSAKPGGRVRIELFANDIAQWQFETQTTFSPEWSKAAATLRYDWDDAEALAAGWKRAANSFSWADTIQHIGKVVIVPGAAGAQESFDLDELSVSGSTR
ncbi:MAG: M15 family metallopeptidase [Prosthecobacter sp.]|uniref:M15 family metallopeptidase n=1 Tax=Prosthecobacter sp. TaxID=1965333 RepID=UPI002600D15F|nr:M15 family metallopeptidase [Prosthecobacter sp.]MCF7786091.1 M15 family metallopeptidase [Prosthecobacter sp.]